MTEHQLNHVSHGGTCIDDSVNELSHLECAAEKFKSSGFTHAMSKKNTPSGGIINVVQG